MYIYIYIYIYITKFNKAINSVTELVIQNTVIDEIHKGNYLFEVVIISKIRKWTKKKEQ